MKVKFKPQCLTFPFRFWKAPEEDKKALVKCLKVDMAVVLGVGVQDYVSENLKYDDDDDDCDDDDGDDDCDDDDDDCDDVSWFRIM